MTRVLLKPKYYGLSRELLPLKEFWSRVFVFEVSSQVNETDCPLVSVSKIFQNMYHQENGKDYCSFRRENSFRADVLG